MKIKIRGITVFFLAVCFSLLVNSCTGKDGRKKAQSLYISALEEYSVHNLAKASELCFASLKMDSEFFQSEFLQGKIYFFNSDYERALKTFSSLIKKYPHYTEARIWKIRTLIMQGSLDEAQKLLESEVVFNGSDWRIFYLYSLCYRCDESLDKELVMLTNAESALKDSAKVYQAFEKNWEILGMESKAQLYKEKSEIIRK